MKQLKKFGCHCAVCLLAYCAAAISPVILIYGVTFGIGIVSDLVCVGDDQALLCVVSPALLWAFSPGRASRAV